MVVTEGVSTGRIVSELFRPQNIRFSLIVFIIAALYGQAELVHIILGSGQLILLYGFATIYNDIHDKDIDIANDRGLPLARGGLSIRVAQRILFLLLLVICLMQLGLRQPYGYIVTITYLLLGWFYSSPKVKLSHRGLLATILLAICYAGLPMVFGFWQSQTIPLYFLLLPLILMSMAVVLFKDFKDLKGDALYSKRTPLVRYGAQKTKLLAGLFFTIGCICLMGFIGVGWWLIGCAIAGLALAQLCIKPRPTPTLVQTYGLGVIIMFALSVYTEMGIT